MTHTTFSIRRVLCTFGVSGNGQVLYMSSASEIQRMSLAKNDRYDDRKQQYTLWAYENILWDFPHLSFLLLCSLNLPACLPDTHIHMKDPQPVNRKESRKYSMVNREHICKNINCAEVDSDQYIDLSVQVLILGNYVNTCISRLWDTCHRCCFLLWWWGLFFFVGSFSQSFISHVLVHAAPSLHPPS